MVWLFLFLNYTTQRRSREPCASQELTERGNVNTPNYTGRLEDQTVPQ